VPVSFFFEDPLKPTAAPGERQALSPSFITDFLITTDGLALTKAFMQVKSPALRRRIVRLVEEMIAAA
jgi:hypothetical protein